MIIKSKIPGWIKYWLKMKKANIIYAYYMLMKRTRITDLKIGDKLYRINNSNGKLLTYTIERIDGSWFTISNETGYICASIQCSTIDNDNINGEYWTHPFIAAWMTIKKIRNEQYKLEQKRIQIIKVNGIKVKINTYPEKDSWIKRTIYNVKEFFNKK